MDISGGCGKSMGGCDGKGGNAGGREKKSEDSPGIAHDEDYDSLFEQADHVLADLVGSVQEFCSIVHDPDWEQFPDVAKAVQAGGGPKGRLAIAACPNAGKWAVGVAAG